MNIRTHIAFLLLCMSCLTAAAVIIPYPLVSSKRATSAASSTLNDSLIAYWKLDEASGTRNDSKNSYHLTDDFTVNKTNGIISDSAWFIAANSESLTRADNDAFSPTNQSFSFAGWCLLDTVSGGVFSKHNGAGNNREYRAILTASRFRFDLATNGVSSVSVSANTFGAPATNTWHFVAFVHDASAQLIKISVNAGAFDTAATGGFWPTNGNKAFQLGTQNEGVGYSNMRLDEFGYWLKALSAAELTELYNSGSGKTCCPF